VAHTRGHGDHVAGDAQFAGPAHTTVVPRDLDATAQLATVRDAAVSVAGQRGVHRFDDFIIYNEPRRSDQLMLMGRGVMHRIRPGGS
jgi:hypothetical protein